MISIKDSFHLSPANRVKRFAKIKKNRDTFCILSHVNTTKTFWFIKITPMDFWTLVIWDTSFWKKQRLTAKIGISENQQFSQRVILGKVGQVTKANSHSKNFATRYNTTNFLSTVYDGFRIPWNRRKHSKYHFDTFMEKLNFSKNQKIFGIKAPQNFFFTLSY